MWQGEDMAQQKRGLGKGLGALIPTTPIGLADPETPVPGPSGLGTVPGAYFDEIPVTSISPNPRQPRQIFDEEALLSSPPRSRPWACSSRSWSGR